MKKYAVYVHMRRDNGKVFYVGCCTRNDSTRARGFKKYRRAFDFGQRRARWFKIVGEAGDVDVDIVFLTDIKDEAFEKEAAFIELYGRESLNKGLLVNECGGGMGAPEQLNTKLTRLKKSAQKIGHKNPMYRCTGRNHPNTRRVFNVKTCKIYESITEAADANGYKMKTLYNWLSGHRKNPTNLRFI